MFNFICLLYPDAHTNTVDTWLDKDLLILVSGDVQRIKQELGGASGFDLGDIVPLGSLRSEVGDGESGSQRRSHTLEVRTQRLRLFQVSHIARTHLSERGTYHGAASGGVLTSVKLGTLEVECCVLDRKKNTCNWKLQRRIKSYRPI